MSNVLAIATLVTELLSLFGRGKRAKRRVERIAAIMQATGNSVDAYKSGRDKRDAFVASLETEDETTPLPFTLTVEEWRALDAFEDLIRQPGRELKRRLRALREL